MDKASFTAWALGESLSEEDAEKIWELASRSVRSPSVNLVEGALAFITAEAIDISMDKSRGLMTTTFPTCEVTDRFDNDPELVKALIDSIFDDPHVIRVSAKLYGGQVISAFHEGDLTKYSISDEKGTFAFTLRELGLGTR